MNKEQIEKTAYDISNNYASEKDLEYLIKELQFWLEERRKQLKELNKQDPNNWEVR